MADTTKTGRVEAKNAELALILRLSLTEFDRDFPANYITVIEDRPIMSVKYCLPVPVFYFWRKL